MGMVIGRFDIFLVNLDPTSGSEIKKTRPCVIISPDEMNTYLKTAIIAPMTSVKRGYPTRIACKFRGKSGEVVLDQIRAIDKRRLVRRMGKLNEDLQDDLIDGLLEMFSR